jgi:hypothetical protein
MRIFGVPTLKSRAVLSGHTRSFRPTNLRELDPQREAADCLTLGALRVQIEKPTQNFVVSPSLTGLSGRDGVYRIKRCVANSSHQDGSPLLTDANCFYRTRRSMYGFPQRCFDPYCRDDRSLLSEVRTSMRAR